MEDQNNNQKINLELPQEVADGKYANLVVVNHSPTEFVLDFVSLLPGVPSAKINNRVLMNPLHAKRLLSALVENVQKFEAQFGEIKELDQKTLHLNDFGAKTEA